jgi:adenylosuccinate synthase
VVADPCKLVWETKALESVGFETLSRLRLDNRLMVSHVGHRLLDLAAEIRSPRGSTGRGISPSYSDESIQGQIFYEAFLGDMAAFSAALEKRLTSATRRIQHEFMLSPEEWNGLFEKLSMAERRAHAALIAKGVLSDSDFDFQRFRHPSQPFSLNMRRIVDCYWEAGTRLAAAITDVTQLSRELSEQKKHLIYEHGQGVLLDKRLGFTPSVTASHTTPAEVHHTNAVPITQSIYAVGVAKAYSTKVGVHLFLTQMEAEHPLAKILSKIEFGTTTGRGRMVGWYDAVEGGWALTHAGAHALIINKLDVLTLSGDWQGPLKICTHYVDPDGNRHFSLPTSDERRKQMTACYEECAGWTEEIQNIRNFTELPLAAQQYVAKLYQATIAAAQGGSIVEYENLPKLHFVGVGPDPGQIICDLPSPQELLRLAKL